MSPIKNILIANRGEIALRIIRTLRKLGISVTGVYSSQDKDSPWIEKCDQAWPLGSGNLQDTYLNINKIIAIAQQAGADAIHPGYGFLAENFLFAEACELKSISFIGPNSGTLKIAGDKPSSREMAASLGLPVPKVITGTPDEILSIKNDIRFPILAKAASGGGGKGIRIVNRPEELAGVLSTISGEAMNYFGDGRIYLEQLLEHARHIEIQILADKHGNSVHLFERECSVQRRHQKIIEESPSVFLSQATRMALAQAALKFSRHLGYTGAGTIEFLVDDKENFFFLEINPRIQVEHGITEMVTGIDIVKEQISIAEDNPLSFTQDIIHSTGHSIEARIYAEDPENNLLPSPGKIHYFCPPLIDDLKIEAGVRNGLDIFPDFDPLIAKLQVHASGRVKAISRMQQAVDQFVIAGIRHNLPVLEYILKDEEFLNNNISTTWFDGKFNDMAEAVSSQRKSTDNVLLGIVAALIILNRKPGLNKSPWHSGFWRNVRQIRFRIGGGITELDYHGNNGNSYFFFYNSQQYEVSKVHFNDIVLEFTVNEKETCWYILPETDGVLGFSDGHLEYAVERFVLLNQDFHITDELSDHDGNMVLAPQPGTVLDIKVAEGQKVNRGDDLLIIESMKLENTILAARAGLIKKINIKTGDRVKKNEPLIYLQETINN